MEEQSFIDKMPNWLRWILFLPASIVGSVLAGGIFLLVNKLTANGWSDTAVLYIQSMIFGVTFVWIAGRIAPTNKLIVSGIMATIMTILASLGFASNLSTHTLSLWSSLIHSLLAIGGALIATYSQYDDLEKKPTNR